MSFKVAGVLQVVHQELAVGEQLGGVGVRDAGVVRVLDIEVVAGDLDLLDRHLRGLLGLLPLLPPLFDVERFDADRVCLVVGLWLPAVTGARSTRFLSSAGL